MDENKNTPENNIPEETEQSKVKETTDSAEIKEKSKLPFIIGGIALGVLVIAVIIALILGGGGGHKHSFSEWTSVKDATCTDGGTEERVCSECGEKETRDVDPLGHTVVVDPAVDATCTADGLTEGKHCSVCDEIITERTTVSAKGHDYADGYCAHCNGKKPSDGLSYRLSSDGTYYIVSGIGTCTDSYIMIPDEHEGLPVHEIGEYAFYYCKTITELGMGDSVKVIGRSAFQGCNALTEVTVGNSVWNIDTSAFYECKSLVKVTLPENRLYNIRNYAFYGCTSLTTINIPSTITYITPHSFEGCTSLKQIVLPEGVEQLWESAFAGCTNLETIYLPKSTSILQPNIFLNCTSLQRVEYSGSIDYWVGIAKGYPLDNNSGWYTIYCTDGTIDKYGSVSFY